MTRSQHAFPFRMASRWSLGVVLASFHVACAPRNAPTPSLGDPVTQEVFEAPSLAGMIDASAIMGPDAPWNPGEAYAEGLADSGSDIKTNPSDPEALDSAGSPLVDDDLASGTSVEIMLPSGASEPSVLPLPLVEVDQALARLAAGADDPVVYEFVRSMLPILAIEGIAGPGVDFQPSTEDLLADELDMMEAVSEFATEFRSKMTSGAPPRDVLIAGLTTLLERLRNESGLRMGRVELCTSIAGYGDVEVTSQRMPVGRDREILVYAEVKGLDWAERADGLVGWDLRYRLQLHQLSDGMVIDAGVESGVSDALVAPVGDNYLWIRYRLPAGDLNAGRYVLKLWIREPSTNREDERSIEIDLLPARLLGREVSSVEP